jgi:hypothetical protein
VKKTLIIIVSLLGVLGIVAYTTFFCLNHYSVTYNEYLDKNILNEVKTLLNENKAELFDVSKSLYPDGESARNITISDIGILKDIVYSASLFNDNESKPNIYRIEVKFKNYSDHLVIATFKNNDKYYLYFNDRKFLFTSKNLTNLLINKS